MNIIFKPNLPTQAILCEEGTHLDITELIKYSINKVPNPRLYREVRDGFVKNYGVSIVIDTSISCLNELCLIHTIQTLRILLSAMVHIFLLVYFLVKLLALLNLHSSKFFFASFNFSSANKTSLFIKIACPFNFFSEKYKPPNFI